jgi:hypothetical protein
MSDGRGGARVGAGRKSKAQEFKLYYLLEEAWPAEDRVAFFRELATKARAGDIEAGKLLLLYSYGKPRNCYPMENRPDSMSSFLD